MPFIQFPSIPPFPGVPPLPRLPGSAQAFVNKVGQTVATINSKINTLNSVIGLLNGDHPSATGSSTDPVWGVYDDSGAPVAIADSFVSFEHSKEYRISNYPLERGSFSSYNKVELPFNQRVTLAKAGSVADRADFLNAIDDAAYSLDLFTVVTPEVTYFDASIVHYEVTRTSGKGVELLLVELTLEEVRISAASTFTKTQNPASAAAVSGGTVQPHDPTPTQAQAAAGGAG